MSATSSVKKSRGRVSNIRSKRKSRLKVKGQVVQSTTTSGAASQQSNWEVIVAHPSFEVVRRVYREFLLEKQRIEVHFAKAIAPLVSGFGADGAAIALEKGLRIKAQNARKYVSWANLFLKLPEKDVWESVGVQGVKMLAACEDRKILDDAVAAVRKMSVANAAIRDGSPAVSPCFVKDTLTKLGAPVAAQANACNKDRNKKVSQAAMKAALADLRRALLSDPGLASYLDPKTVEIAKAIV